MACGDTVRFQLAVRICGVALGGAYRPGYTKQRLRMCVVRRSVDLHLSSVDVSLARFGPSPMSSRLVHWV